MTIRQQFIIDCVKDFIKKHPQQYKIVVQSVKQQKAVKKNKYGLTDNDSAYMRWTLRIPERLFKALDMSLDKPKFLDSSGEMEWFKKTFPMFKVSEK